MTESVSRRFFLRAACAGAAGACLGGKAHGAQPADRPNIVFFLVDDQRNDTLGCAVHPILKTPHVDCLASESVRFRNAFVTTSICAASRASIFTGLHERTHGYTFGKPPVPASYTDTSYPALLRQAGYRTGFIGKFGVGVTIGAKEAMFDSFTPLTRNPYHKKQTDGSFRHETELAGDRAIDFIAENPGDQPFCLSISFNAVHAEDNDKKDHYPWPKAVDGMYDDEVIPPPRLGDPVIFESQPRFLRESMNRERHFWRWDTPEKYQRNMRAYFRMITGVDRVVGRVRDALAAHGLDKNTVVIYTADNGYYMGNRGFAGKWSHYEESLRVPLIIHDPRMSPALDGEPRDRMALNIDIPATMLEIAGVAPPAHYQGRSLVPLLRDAATSDWRTEFFCEHLMEHKAIPRWEGVRGERYVYARYFGQDPSYEFLHDLQVDPDQLTNFVADPAYAETLARMRRRCDQLRDACKPAKVSE